MHIRISIPAQMLDLLTDDGRLLKRYNISTAKNGAGEVNGSYQTPRGRHIIRAKIGAGLPENSVLVRRRPTGEICTPELQAAHPRRDWILTRILWLSGKEPGSNRLGEVDTMRRYIYLHGSPDNIAMGTPGSIGCVRMRNADIIELFDLVPPYTPVNILPCRLQETDWVEAGNAILSVRSHVFVSELDMPAFTKTDEWDASACHVVAYGSEGEAIGAVRMLAQGYIGHMAVVREWRGRGIGRALFERLLEAAKWRGIGTLTLHAKTPVADFYAKFGFVQMGDVFIEAGKPHVKMIRQQ